jgi:integrase
MATVYFRKDRGKWYLEYRLPGGKVTRRVAGTNRRQAELVKKEVELQLARGELLPTRRELVDELKRELAPHLDSPTQLPEVTIVAFIKEYNEHSKQNKAPDSSDTDARRLKYFQEYNTNHFGRRLLKEVTPRDIEAYRSLKLRTCQPQTVESYLISLHAAFAKAVEWNYLFENPVKGLYRVRGKEKKIPRFLDKVERDALLEAAEGTPALPGIAVAVFAGLRSKEVRHLTWGNIDFEQGLIFVRRTKGHSDRTVPISQRLRAILEPLKKPKGLVFPSQAGTPHDKDSIRKVVNRIYTKAGVVATGIHILRHTFASHLVMAGVSIFKVSQWLGHADVKTTMVYTHLAPLDEDINRQ